MHAVAFLQDLAVVMIVAGITTIICHQLKQPVVLGYIIAGVIIGPHTPPFPLIKDEETIKTLAELGLVFLMFSLGLEFSLRKLRKVGFTALTAATLEILLMVWLGYQIGRAFGWKTMDCVFLGAMISISSTTIIVKALGELGLSKEKFAELLPSWKVLIVLSLIVAVMTALFWRTLIRIYSKGQVALEETFAEVPLPRPVAPPSSMGGILKEAQLETVTILKNSHAAGRLIGELALRTQTGASVVGIERVGGLSINPGAGEEIQEGDQVLLLGRAEQLEAARRLLLTQRDNKS